jgi:hypothetical protein
VSAGRAAVGRRARADAPRVACIVALAWLALGAGCGGPLDIGTDPNFLWWTDHETGLDDWLRGGTAAGSSYATGGGTVSVDAGLARSGRYALTSTAGAAGTTSAGQVTRRGITTDAYYGAWFYLTAVAQPATYWVFFSFHGDDAAGGDTALWDLKFADSVNDPGALELQLLHHDTGDVTPLAHVAVPLGRWFQVQAFLRPAADDTGLLQIWLEGTPIFDLPGATTPAATPSVSWTLGSITDGLTPAPTSLSIDDAFIAKRQIEPTAPPFWRAPK